MNRNKLKTYAPLARREFIQVVTERAAFYGLTEKKIEPLNEQDDVTVIGGRAFPKSVAAKRKRLEQRIARDGFPQTMEALAYTWFNRFVAIRYMELHGYRVLSPSPQWGEGWGEGPTPEIIEHAEHAFECLVYLHRYHEGTLPRMRTEYVIPLLGRIEARIKQLKDDITAGTSTAHGKRLQKERDKLIKQQGELQKFDEKRRHYADRRIQLDLDDGVKVN